MTVPHFHDDSGAAIFPDTPPDPAEVEAAAVTTTARTEADAEVRIAEIEAATALELAKLERTEFTYEERLELEALRAECENLRGELSVALSSAEPATEPAPGPEVVEVQAPEPEPGQPTDPPEREGSPEPGPKKKPGGLGMWR